MHRHVDAISKIFIHEIGKDLIEIDKARFLGSYKLKVIPLIYVKHFAKATLTILKEIKPFLFEQNSRFYLSTILYIINVGNMSD